MNDKKINSIYEEFLKLNSFDGKSPMDIIDAFSQALKGNEHFFGGSPINEQHWDDNTSKEEPLSDKIERELDL